MEASLKRAAGDIEQDRLERIREKHQQAANGTAEAFRSKLVEMLSVFQPPFSSFTP
jgi:hypothetical protein